MNILLTTLNAKYIHKNLALRWLYVTKPEHFQVDIKEYSINDDLDKIIIDMDVINYNVLGISVYIWNAELTKILIDKIKQVNPVIRIILGGPEVTYENDEWFDHPIEAIVVGEGEKVFWEYLKGEDCQGVKLTRSQTITPVKVDIAWLECFDNPYFLDIDQDTINNRYLYLECSRGCPYKCQYCLSSVDDQVRFFSLPYLFKIFDQLTQYDIRQVKFLDRTFNVYNQRALTLIKYLNELPVKSNFHMELVAESLSDELLDYLIKQADPTRFRFEIGVQSFNIKTLKSISRYTNIERLNTVVKSLVARQIIVHTDLIAGLPFEDLNSFARSYDQLYALHSHEIQVGILKMLKGTPLKNRAKELGINYQEKAPYDIIDNKWLSSDDLAVIQCVDLATDKTLNSQKISHTINELINYQKASPFWLMSIIGKAIKKLGRPYQNKELFMVIYQELIDHYETELIQRLLLIDYYYHSRQRPQSLFNLPHDKHKINQFIKDHHFINDHIKDNYTIITPVVYHDEWVYQLVLYNNKQLPAKTYILDLNKETIKELV